MAQGKRGASRLGELFSWEPDEWSLRGDPYLWAEMRTVLTDHPLPASKEALADSVTAAFLELTERDLYTARDPFSVERFAHGGMSSGYVDPAWWRDEALPQLAARLRAHRDEATRFREVLEAVLVKRPRRLRSEAVAAFIDDAAAEVATLADTFRWVDEQMPEGWDKQYNNPQRSLESLARALRLQTTYGRRALFKQAMLSRSGLKALQALATGDTHDDLDSAINNVVKLILAAADPRGEKPRWHHPARAEEIAQVVRCMEKLWRTHMDKEPKAADGAPFSDAVSTVWAEISGGESLSWPVIRKVLQNSATPR